MVQVGGTPLLERQVQRLAKASIPRCYIAVNYLSQVIEDYFGDGREFGIRIEYLREKVKMGTAGALSLIPVLPDGPLLVMNGDILTTSDFENLYNYHVQHRAQITVGAVHYFVQIPYGVIHCNGPSVYRLEEKPSQRFLCNAGIYVVEPQVLPRIPNGFFNMTDLIELYMHEKAEVSVFPVHEYWSDIGTPDDLEKARKAFSNRCEE